MRVVRAAAAVLVALAALLAIDRVAVRPWRANLELRAVTDATSEALQERESAGGVILARNNLNRLERLRQTTPENVEMLMLIAANERILHRYDRAQVEYEHALEIEKRPEIYVNLADTLLRQGRRGEAIEAYRSALEFDPTSIDLVDPSVRDDLIGRN